MDKFVVGPLCKRGHKYEERDQSLRYVSTRQCVECMKERAQGYRREYYEKNAGECRARGRAHYYKNREKRLAQMAEYRKTGAVRESMRRYRLRNPGKCRARVMAWRAANPEAVKRGWKRWADTPRGRMMLRANSIRRQARMRSAIGGDYSPADVRARFAEFGNACAYCGRTEELTIDHVIPVAKNGHDKIYNIAPACSWCNTSKRDRDVEARYRDQPFYSEEDWQLIKGLVNFNP